MLLSGRFAKNHYLRPVKSHLNLHEKDFRIYN